jgi:hypothetical protein
VADGEAMTVACGFGLAVVVEAIAAEEVGYCLGLGVAVEVEAIAGNDHRWRRRWVGPPVPCVT